VWRSLLVAVFFGFARAAGETMAVQMVIGGARKLPTDFLFSPTTTISAQIVMDMQEARPGTAESDVLFSMALVLLLVSVAVVLVTRALSKQGAR
jgi:phosphate transport system permease protein